MKRKRPFSVTFLAGLVLLVAVSNILRLAQAVLDWGFLAGLLAYLPVYLALTGLVWGALGLPLAWGIWRGKSWAPRICHLALLIYSIYYWFDRLVLPGYVGRNSNWQFAAGINLLILVWDFWSLTHRKARDFFGEVYERKPQSTEVA